MIEELVIEIPRRGYQTAQSPDVDARIPEVSSDKFRCTKGCRSHWPLVTLYVPHGYLNKLVLSGNEALNGGVSGILYYLRPYRLS